MWPFDFPTAEESGSDYDGPFSIWAEFHTVLTAFGLGVASMLPDEMGKRLVFQWAFGRDATRGWAAREVERAGPWYAVISYVLGVIVAVELYLRWLRALADE